MIVFDLKCSQGHVFEAWFVSSEGFVDQKARGLLCCSFCGSASVEKAPMAAQIPAKGNRSARVDKLSAVTNETSPAAEFQTIKAALDMAAKAQAKMLEKSSWVGRAFDQNARAMDAGEIPHAPIHGEVSPKEAAALKEDGIAVAPLPFPVIPPEKRN